MGVMNKMRENTAVVLWILVFAFGIIWVFNDAGGFDALGRDASDNIGYVDGVPISRQKFVETMNLYERQLSQMGQSITSEQRDQYSDIVFNSLVDEILRERELERLGLEVTDKEVQDMIWGPNPDPQIKQLFPDGSGGVNLAAIQNFIDVPENRPQWLEIQEGLRKQRLQQKLDQLISSTVTVSDTDIKEEYVRRSQNVSADYVALRYADIPDSTVTVTEGDLRSYYNKNKDKYKRKKTYHVAFASAAILATPSDTLRVTNELMALRDTFSVISSDEVPGFVSASNSATPFDVTYKTPADITESFSSTIADIVYEDLSEGRVIGPISDGEKLHLFRIHSTSNLAKPLYKARHILFGGDVKNEAELAKMKQRADSVKTLIAGGANFEEMARQNSTGPSASTGGDLGWSDGENYVPEFKEAFKSAPLNQVVGPVQTQFGYHLILLTDRADKSVQLADVSREIQPGNTSVDNLREALEDIAFYASESGDFAGEVAKKTSISLQETDIEEGSNNIPLIGPSRAARNFASTAKVGTISDVIELSDKYIVMQLESIKPEGFASFDEVKEQLQPLALLDKKKEIQVKKFKDTFANNKSLDAMNKALGTSPRSASDLSFNNTLVPTLGREPKFVGAALALSEGKLSQVIEGDNAVYVLKVTAKTKVSADDLDEATLQNLRNELTSQRQQQVRTRWLADLREKADVQDRRNLFGL